MKIALFDPNCYKFTDDMVEHWEASGHEVKKTLYYDPALVDWADIIWFETCDHNLEVATRTGEAGWKFSDMDMSGKKVICRVIDIEVWCGLHRSVDWNYVDEVIFLAKHIKDEVEKDVKLRSAHVIPCGVNVDKFTFSPTDKKNIAWVAERWHAKGIDYFLQYAAMLWDIDPEFKICSVGVWEDNAKSGWYRAYIDQFLKTVPMNVEFIDRVDDMNEFLKDMGYAICFSKKETFSYAIAEGMCSGCKPIIHNFYGARDVWPDEYVWDTIDEAIDLTINGYNPQVYRDWIVNNYSHTRMLESFDKIINKKGA